MRIGIRVWPAMRRALQWHTLHSGVRKLPGKYVWCNTGLLLQIDMRLLYENTVKCCSHITHKSWGTVHSLLWLQETHIWTLLVSPYPWYTPHDPKRTLKDSVNNKLGSKGPCLKSNSLSEQLKCARQSQGRDNLGLGLLLPAQQSCQPPDQRHFSRLCGTIQPVYCMYS